MSTNAGDSSDDISTGSQPLHSSQESEVSEEGSQGTQKSQSTQGSQSTQPLSQFRGCKMSDRVRAVAFLTLGKLWFEVLSWTVTIWRRRTETSWLLTWQDCVENSREKKDNCPVFFKFLLFW